MMLNRIFLRTGWAQRLWTRFWVSAQGGDQRSLMVLYTVAFFWGFSSLMIFVATPLLMKRLGASNTALGWMEGLAFGAAFLSKIFSGLASDYWGRRLPFIWMGALGSLLAKVGFALCTNLGMLQFMRVMDRLSKGIRTGPADALVADLTQPQHRGIAFGIKQSIWTLGSALGACLSCVLLFYLSPRIELIFWIACLPAALALFGVHSALKEGKRAHLRLGSGASNRSFSWEQIRSLPAVFWKFLIVVGILMMARFSEIFLILYAKSLGWKDAALPIVVILMDLVHAGVAYLSAPLNDRLAPKALFFWSTLILTLATWVFAWKASLFCLLSGLMINGVHLGLTQGLMKKMIAEHTPSTLQGTAFALFYTTCGIGVMIGNPIAGYLCRHDEFRAMFLVAGGFAWAAALILKIWIPGPLRGRPT